MGQLDDQVAIVTGAGRGIGRAIAVRCAAEGAKVAIAARTLAQLEDTAEAIKQVGGTALILPTDVTDRHAVQMLVGRTQAELGQVSLLVNDAGRLRAVGPSWELEPRNWWNDVTVNMLGVFHCCRAVLPVMIEQGHGRIVNMVGGGTTHPFPFASAYGSSKAAVMRFTETVAQELTETNASVRIFALSPGFVRTAMTEQFARTEVGRRWMQRLIERLEHGDDVSPDNAANMVVEIAAGRLDELHGRYVHGPDDVEHVDEILKRSAQIVEDDARALRVR
jgi:NAD(P)-dependent dehydrogenase (short-subunit alcohol dehydrogenase family)